MNANREMVLHLSALPLFKNSYCCLPKLRTIASALALSFSLKKMRNRRSLLGSFRFSRFQQGDA